MTYQNILIVKLSAIGDVIHALPVAPALKQCFPQTRLTWVVEPPAYDVLTNNPCIDEIIVFEKKRCKSLAGLYRYAPAFIRELRERRFDLALDLQGLFKSAAISWLSGAPERLVYCDAREHSDWIGKKICGPNLKGHIVERYLDVARALGCRAAEPEFIIKITAAEFAQAGAIAHQAGLDSKNPYVILMPGTNWPNKCWPADHFATLAGKLFASGLIPVFVGSAADQNAMQAIQGQSAVPLLDLTGKTSLKQLAALIKNARAVVAGDTGPMHLAAAIGTPVVALFGPTDPRRNGPCGPGHVVLTTSHACTGCWQRKCLKELECLVDISPALVYQSLVKMVG
ncbi:lipopolysaccharide heptosyltransferase I [Sporomusa termitida]|uniref:Lipopolysaccharide heptosyltransferase 1 n=1 Tax=Sporomusa termitida TaxID=2377 RepID=A0A517DXS1_9FIRM|nr:lipopolysaccharide heptosyltransferase I [Sporomusa termitida]QDR82046.1 ADP-heptose--LPS heptosyltransferase 2 [Sporomusa termitida]